MTILEKLTWFAQNNINLPYRELNAKFWDQFGFGYNGTSVFNTFDGTLTLYINDASIPGAVGHVQIRGRAV